MWILKENNEKATVGKKKVVSQRTIQLRRHSLLSWFAMMPTFFDFKHFYLLIYLLYQLFPMFRELLIKCSFLLKVQIEPVSCTHKVKPFSFFFVTVLVANLLCDFTSSIFITRVRHCWKPSGLLSAVLQFHNEVSLVP